MNQTSSDTSSRRIIGLEPGVVRLLPHAPEWRAAYEVERDELIARIGPYVVDVQHIGSTSIPGIVAKPIIDIAVAVESFDEAIVCVEPLTAYGYRYYGENGIPRRHYFSKGEPRTHHLHMMEIGGYQWRKHILFRDYLLAHPGDAAAYALLKQELAVRFERDREAYTEGKSGFIEEILRRAELWSADRQALQETPREESEGNGAHE